MKRAYAAYFSALLLFGTNGIVASHIHLASEHIVLLRTLLGNGLLMALCLRRGQGFSCVRHPKELGWIALSGVAMGMSWVLLYAAYALVGVSIASLLYYTGPVLVMALSPIVFQERLTKGRIAGFAVVFCGVLLVNGGASGQLNARGMLYGALSALMYAVMVIANKQAKRIVGLENALIQLVASFLTVAIFVGIRHGGYAMAIPASDVGWIVLLGLVNTGLGCYGYFTAIGKLPVQTVAICGYLEPLSAVVCAALLLHEALSPWQLVGAALVIGGAVLGECATRTR